VHGNEKECTMRKKGGARRDRLHHIHQAPGCTTPAGFQVNSSCFVIAGSAGGRWSSSGHRDVRGGRRTVEEMEEPKSK